MDPFATFSAYRTIGLAVLLCLLPACDGTLDTADENDVDSGASGNDGSETGGNDGSETGGNAGPTTLPPPCEKLRSYLEEDCGLSDKTVSEWIGACVGKDGALNDAFMNDLTACLADLDCETYKEGPFKADPFKAAPIDICFEETASDFPASEKNQLLQEHYCALEVECGKWSSLEECRADEYLVELFEFYNTLRDSVVEKIDACVFPVNCEKDIKSCIDEAFKGLDIDDIAPV